MPAPPPTAGPAWAPRALLLWFAFATLAQIWPLFGWLGNRITPRVLGLPWSLVWVLSFVGVNFIVLLWAYRRGLFRNTETDE